MLLVVPNDTFEGMPVNVCRHCGMCRKCVCEPRKEVISEQTFLHPLTPNQSKLLRKRIRERRSPNKRLIDGREENE